MINLSKDEAVKQYAGVVEDITRIKIKIEQSVAELRDLQRKEAELRAILTAEMIAPKARIDRQVSTKVHGNLQTARYMKIFHDYGQPITAKELAELANVPVTTAWSAMGRYEKYGLIRKSGKKKTGNTKPQALYELVVKADISNNEHKESHD